MKICRIHLQIMQKKGGRSLQRTGGAWNTKPFTNWKKVTQKMKLHSKVKCTFYPVNWTWKLIEKKRRIHYQPASKCWRAQRFQNRKAINALIRCTHFLAHQHIAHTTNFDKLVELIVSCGGETLQTFLDRAGGNATYTSKMAVVELLLEHGWKSLHSRKFIRHPFLASTLMNALLLLP